jgi:hypothetical protein
MQAADRGFAEVLTMTFPAAIHLEAQRRRAYLGFLELVDRAKATGRLRPDFTSADLVILLMANAGVIAATHTASPQAWRRLVAYMLQAFAAPQPATLPPAPDPDDLARAMTGLNCAADKPARAEDSLAEVRQAVGAAGDARDQLRRLPAEPAHPERRIIA